MIDPKKAKSFCYSCSPVSGSLYEDKTFGSCIEIKLCNQNSKQT